MKEQNFNFILKFLPAMQARWSNNLRNIFTIMLVLFETGHHAGFKKCTLNFCGLPNKILHLTLQNLKTL